MHIFTNEHKACYTKQGIVANKFSSWTLRQMFFLFEIPVVVKMQSTEYERILVFFLLVLSVSAVTMNNE